MGETDDVAASLPCRVLSPAFDSRMRLSLLGLSWNSCDGLPSYGEMIS